MALFLLVAIAVVSGNAEDCSNSDNSCLDIRSSSACSSRPHCFVQLNAAHRASRSVQSPIPLASVVPQLYDGRLFVPWNLCNSTLVQNNLGGKGPDAGLQEMRFASIYKDSAVEVDLVITVYGTSTYTPYSNASNKLHGCFGQVNFQFDTETTLLHRFEATNRTNPSQPPFNISFPSFFFTVYDVDHNGIIGFNREVVRFHEKAIAAYTYVPSDLDQSGSISFGNATFTSTEHGIGADNPFDPAALTELQKQRAVMIEYGEQFEFRVTHKVVGGNQGRNILFAGYSQALAPPCIPAATCEIYADPHVIGFDTLDSQGPAELALVGISHGRPMDVNAYSEGDFWLLKNPSVQIQGRFRLSQEFQPDKAAVGAVAVGGPFLGGDKLVIEARDGKVMWNGIAMSAGSFKPNSTSGDVQLWSEEDSVAEEGKGFARFEAQLPLGVLLKVNRFNHHLDVKITSRPLPGGVDGECGNWNGNDADDSEGDVRERMGQLAVDSGELLFAPKQ